MQLQLLLKNNCPRYCTIELLCKIKWFDPNVQFFLGFLYNTCREETSQNGERKKKYHHSVDSS